MKKFFEEGKIPSEKVERFSAIKHDVGIVGCAMSHIAILKRAKQEGWKSVLILEDDLQWADFDCKYPGLEALVSSRPWDVCMLGGLYLEYKLPKITMAVCTNAYIVKSHYYDTLLNNFETGLRRKTDVKLPMFPIISEGKRIQTRNKIINKRDEFNVDTYWFKLQEKDDWIGVEPMFEQVNTFSDIYNRVVNHQTIDYEYTKQYAYSLKKLMNS
jgi:glycosyl transferase family 25